MELGFEVLAEGGGDYAGGGKVAEVGDGDFGEVGEDCGESCAGGADQGQADVVDAGPAAMLSNGLDYVERDFFAGEGF